MTDKILEALRQSYLEEPQRQALISPRGSLTVEELERRSSACARGLANLGLEELDRVALLVTPGADFLVCAFGLLKCGCSMVLIDPGIGRENMGACLEEAEPKGFIGIPLAHLARKWLGWATGTLRVTISTGFRWGLAGHSLPEIERAGESLKEELPPARSDEHPVAIAFTSGSTGPPKGVIYTQRMFEAQVRMLRQAFSIAPGEVDLATFPLFGLFDVGWRATTVFPNMDYTKPGSVDPEMLVRLIRERKVTHMFGSPALIDRVSRHAAPLGVKLPSLRRVLSAGAPVSGEILERCRSLLTGPADVHTPYGSTEALPVSTIEAEQILEERGSELGRGVCVGTPFPGVEVAILAISDEPIEDWSDDLCLGTNEVGEIAVTGDNVSQGYYDRPTADRLSKIRDGERMWHRMGDLGYRDEQGRLWFCGRKSHRVEVAGMTLFTVQVEGVYNQHPDVFRSALVGIGDRGSQRPVLCVQLEAGNERTGDPALVSEVLQLGRSLPFGEVIDTVLFHPDFPVDIRHNAKIFREKLALWAEQTLEKARGDDDV